MFKSTRWRSEKKKIKAVFKLQFQATQVPHLRGKTLMVSLVPEDVGKPTVRLQKAAVLEGTCSWENPIYETVKLIRETTGRYKEKIYHFIVSTGSSKAGFLGEVSLDFADYAETTNPLEVSLPLNTPNSGGILHVTVQKMQGTNDLRYLEENEAPRAKELDRSLKNQMNDHNRYENSNLDFTEDEHFKKVTSQDAERHSSFKDPPLENSTIHQDFTMVRHNSMPQKKTVSSRRSNIDWSVGSTSEGSMIDSTNSPEENFPRDVPEVSYNSIELLKNEISMLERQAEISELELQSLRKQIVKESRRGQDLSHKIVSLKEERDELNAECQQLKSTHKRIEEAEVSNKLELDTEKLRVQLEEIRKELKHEKGLNKKLWSKLQRSEDSNSELILKVKDHEKMLEQKHMEIEVYRKEKEEQKMHIERLALEYETLKQESHNISSKFEGNQIEQMKVQNEYSESLFTIEGFKLQVERLEKEIKKQALESSESLYKINELETHVKRLKKTNEELGLTKDWCEGKVEELLKQKILQAKQIEQMSLELEDKHTQVESFKKHEEENKKAFSIEIQALKGEMESLKMKEMNTLVGELHTVQRWSKERDELEREFASVRKVAEKLEEESCAMRTFKDEKEIIIGTLRSGMKNLRDEYNELNCCLFNIELEKEDLRKQVVKLEGELQKKEEAITVIDKNVNIRSEHATHSDTRQMTLKDGESSPIPYSQNAISLTENLKSPEERIVPNEATIEKANSLVKEKGLEIQIEEVESRGEKQSRSFPEDEFQKEARPIYIGKNNHPETSSTEGKSKQNGFVTVPVKSEVETCPEKELNESNCYISDDSNITILLSDVSSLKERNKQMEVELKEMQEKYSEVSLKFAEVESERQQLVMTLRNLKNGKKK